MLFACLADDLLSFSLYLRFIVIKGSEGSINGLADFILGDIRERLGKHLLQLFDQLLFVEQTKIIVEEMYLGLIQITDIGVQHLRIVGYNRAVIAVFRALLIYIVGHAGIEDVGDSLLQQPFDMAVHQLGRIADGVAGDGSLTKTVNCFIFNRTMDNLEAQAGEQGIPEGKQLVHIQAHRYTHNAAFRRFVNRQFLEQLQLLTVQVQLILGRHVGDGALAAVAADKALAAGKGVDG